MRQFMSRHIGNLLCALILMAVTVSVGGAQQIQYGVYIGDQSMVDPISNFNLFSAGTNSTNVFEGRVGIGTTGPNYKLEAQDNQNADKIVASFSNNHISGLSRAGIRIAAGGSGSPRMTYVLWDSADYKWSAGIDSADGNAPFNIAYGVNPTINPRFTIIGSGNVGIGTTNPTSRLYVVGDITATGVKNFQIAHPVEPERKLLIHSALEGPEAAVYYRGEAQLKDGKVEVALPTYFEALTRKQQRTVQLTPIDGWSPLYVVEGIQDGQFTVRAGKEGNPTQRFYWEVKAVRADVPRLVVEKPRGTE